MCCFELYYKITFTSFVDINLPTELVISNVNICHGVLVGFCFLFDRLAVIRLFVFIWSK